MLMTGHVASSNKALTSERRAATHCASAPRLERPLPVIVLGLDAAGDRFAASVVLDSLSMDGLYVRLVRLL